MQSAPSTNSNAPSGAYSTNSRSASAPSASTGTSTWGAGRGSFGLKPQPDGIWRDGHRSSSGMAEAGSSASASARSGGRSIGATASGMRLPARRSSALASRSARSEDTGAQDSQTEALGSRAFGSLNSSSWRPGQNGFGSHAQPGGLWMEEGGAGNTGPATPPSTRSRAAVTSVPAARPHDTIGTTAPPMGRTPLSNNHGAGSGSFTFPVQRRPNFQSHAGSNRMDRGRSGSRSSVPAGSIGASGNNSQDTLTPGLDGSPTLPGSRLGGSIHNNGDPGSGESKRKPRD
jgi:hypothetical protein